MKLFRKLFVEKYLIVVLFLSCMIISCDALKSNGICTQEFVILGVTVLDENEMPVVLNHVTVTNKRTNKVLDFCDEPICTEDQIAGNPQMGFYTIYHDGLRDELSFYTVPILFEGKNDTLEVQQAFLVKDNGCHVEKTAGPGLIIVE